MSNATQHSQSVPASQAGRRFSRFVRTSIKPVIFKLSRKLSVTYWPGRRRTISGMLLVLLSGFVPGLVAAAPTGGQVVAGTATILKPNNSTTQINQASQNAVINWQNFSIGANEAVRFVQPSASAVTLNRVIGADPSRIFGSLSANGKVFLVNSAGVYFAPGASVDVGGLVASTMNISNSNFMAGNYRFDAGAGAGTVDNAGKLSGAFVVLAAPQVSNSGEITTAGGATALAAGGRVSLDIAGDKLVSLSVDSAVANAAVKNSGSISADGGKVFMSASSANAVLDTVINTSGIVRASSIVERNGQIVIDGGSAGMVKVGGSLAASGTAAGTTGGAVQVLGDKVALAAGASIDVSGDKGGGQVLVGGDLHGAGSVRNASTTQVAKGAVINADAISSGDGGKVVVWSNEQTAFAGEISARGGAQSGNGGMVETSGKHKLAFAGKVDTRAAHGKTGSLLLDPSDITIDGNPTDANVSGGTVTGAGDSSTLNATDLANLLNTTDVTVDTTSAFSGSGNIVVNAPVSWAAANSLTLQADANITVNAAITSGAGGNINLFGDGAVSTGTLSTTSGLINVAGKAGLGSNAASITGGNLSTTTGNVNLRASGAVGTGTINAGSGTIDIVSSGNVVIDGALATTNTGNAAISVQAGAGTAAGTASGGDITVSGGTVSVGAGGYATLYTGSVAGSTGLTGLVGSGSGNFRYGSTAAQANFGAALTSGVSAVYREAPAVTVTAGNASITYGDAVPVVGVSASGLQNGDSVVQAFSGIATIGGPLSGSGQLAAGSHTADAGALGNQLGYSLTPVNGTVTVGQKALTMSGLSVPASKTYDGTTTATVSGTPALAASQAAGSGSSSDGTSFTGDVVSISGTASGTYNSKDVASASSVTFGGLSLGGADGANYTLTMQSPAAATIVASALTASASAPNKVYDGNNIASPTLTITGGLASGETINVSGTGTFNSPNVASATTVTVDTVALSNGPGGELASNYSLAPGQTAAASITPKPLTATVAAPNKVYDGTATASASATLAGLVGSETLGNTASASFNSKDVLSANQVTVNAISLADGSNGGLASNYSIAAGQTVAASITPKALVGTASASGKVYDGTTNAGSAVTVSGLVGSETLGVTANASFNSKDVLAANQVTINSIALADGSNGGLASNYSVTAGQTVAANITAKPLAATVAAADKVYDGSTSAAVSLSINPATLVGSETVGASGTGAFNSKDVAAASTATVTAVALSDGSNGGLASNYSLGIGQSTSAHITPKGLTATATAASKPYDGTTAASATATLAGLVGAETLNSSTVADFSSKDAATAIQVTVKDITLANGSNGGIASNYAVGTGQVTSATITPRELAPVAVDKIYDGNKNLALTLGLGSNLVGTETLVFTINGLFNSKDVLTANTATVTGFSLSNGGNGGLGSNYTIPLNYTTAGHILPKPLSATTTAPNKVYDGSRTASPTLAVIPAGLVGTETVTATGTGLFNTKDVLTADTVTVTAATLANGANGGLASNYTLPIANVGTYAAHITTKPLTATADTATKVYDGNTAASLTMSINPAGLVGTETVSASATGTYSSKNVNGTAANNVTVSSVALANGANGGLASNYSLGTGQVGAGVITRRPTVNWLGTVSNDWANPANWENGAIPDLANVANVVIGSGKTANFSSTVPTGVVSLDGVSGGGGLIVTNGTLKVANALTIGNYAQAAGELDVASMKASSSFAQSGGKIDAGAGLVDISQASGTINLGDIKAGSLSVAGGASVTQQAGSALTISGTTTLAAGAGDVTLNNANDFGKITFVSGHDEQIKDINAVEISGNVGGNLAVNSASLTIGSTTVGGNFNATAQGAIIQNGNLNVGGSTTLSTAGTLQLDGTRSGAKVNVTTGGDANIAATGTVAIGGVIGGKLVLTATGAVNQNAGDSLKVTGTSSIDAGTNAVTLTEAGNHFGAPLSLKGGAVSVVDSGALTLGQSTVGGNLAVTAGSNVGQSGKLTVAGTTSVTAKNGTVTLADATNSFAGKLTLDAVNAVVAAGVPLLVDANVASSLTLTAPSMTVASANPLNLHVNTGAATVTAGKAVLIDGSVTGGLTLSAGGAVTQGAALTVGGATSIDAGAQTVTLDNAGNDFGGDLTIKAAGATKLADKNALSLGASAIGGDLTVGAKGLVSQTGALTVAGKTAIDTTGAINLANDNNDFVGNVGGSASSVVLADKNVLTFSKLTAPTVDLRAGTEMHVIAGGLIDATDVALSLSSAGKQIGDPTVPFEVKPNAKVVLGANTPAVPAYFGGAGVTLTVLNPSAKAAYVQEITPLFLGYGQVYRALVSNATSSVSSSISHILTATQKKADSNAELIERGLPSDLTVPIPYPHEGKVKARPANCPDGSAPAEGGGCGNVARVDM